MYSVEERGRVLASIVEHARADDVVTACALVGSAARGELDAWSDVDVALRLAPGAAVDDVAVAWTAWLSATQEVADTFDVRASGALYRVFLLASSLQVDLSFWPDDEFRSTGEPLSLVFGDPVPTRAAAPPNPHDLIATGWLYGLHARSALRRGRAWQAEMMIGGVRDQVIALACLRLGLNWSQGRGAHRLPPEVAEPLAAARARDLSPAEQSRSLRSTLARYLAEVALHDPDAAAALEPVLVALQAPVDGAKTE